jgi:nicotinamide riboside kinase
MIKVALVGTFCSGKTTLWSFLKNKVSDSSVVFTEEVSRPFLEKRNLSVTERDSYEIQREIQRIIIDKETQAQSNNPGIIICDSCVLAPAIYLLASKSSDAGKNLLEDIDGYLKTYRKFYFLDADEIPYLKDDVRIEDERTRQIAGNLYLQYLQDNLLNYKVVSGTVEQRASLIIADMRLMI